MDKDKKLEFYELFVFLLATLTHADGYDIKEIQEALGNVCEFFNISKCLTEFYKSVSYEKAGHGEIFVGYDIGGDAKYIRKW